MRHLAALFIHFISTFARSLAHHYRPPRYRMDAEANDSARLLIHDHQDSVPGRLAPEQIDAPEDVFHVAQERQPGRTTGVRSMVPRSVGCSTAPFEVNSGCQTTLAPTNDPLFAS